MSLKIMVVDEPVSLKLMRSLVVPLGHKVLTFENSEEAGQEAEKLRFDVVFVGMGMPHPDGPELARRIRNSELNRETNIVMLSATSDIEILRKALRGGATFVLKKPITAASLMPMLTAMESLGWKDRRHAARLPLFTEVNCKWGDQQFPLRSMNISESGMLLQSSVDVEQGQEVSLEFKIAEVRASLNVRARIVRKDAMGRVGVQFTDLTPEDKNAIQLYVIGHLKGQTPPREGPRIGLRRLFDLED